MANGIPYFSDKYALIKDGVVVNVIVADSYPTAGKIGEAHGVDEVREVNQYDVSIGDAYVDGAFYHEGDEVERQLLLEEENELLKQRLTATEDVIMALLFPPM